MMKRLAKVKERFMRPGNSLGSGHSLHCSEEILKAMRVSPVDSDRLHSAFRVGFTTCLFGKVIIDL
jgi:hypothetical protein